jgi:hypothetical protein
MEPDRGYPHAADETLVDRGIERLERHRPAAPTEGSNAAIGRVRPPRPRLAFPAQPEGAVDTPVTSAVALEEAPEARR